MTNKSIRSTLLFAALVAAGPVGCGGSKKSPGPGGSNPAEMGSVTFMLTATGSSGTLYRLRSATFMVAGPENKTVMSPTDPADTEVMITTQLRPGAYQVTLAPGWQMWRIPTSGAPVAVTGAALISPTTVAFNIVSSQDAKVTYQFSVPGDSLVPGTLTIGITVSEDGGVSGAAGAAGAGGSGAAGAAGAGGVVGSGGAAGMAGAAGAGGVAGRAGAGGVAGAAGAGGVTASAGAGGSAVATGSAGAGGAAVSMCMACEMGKNAAGDACIGVKYVPASTVIGCGGLPASQSANCTTLLTCLQTHPNCSNPANVFPPSTDPTACFCGALDAASCSGAQANTITGPCASAYFALYGGVSNANRDAVLGDFFAKATATGMANNMYACDVSNDCQSKCP